MPVETVRILPAIQWVPLNVLPLISVVYALQDAARAARRGLWADNEPVPPWERRRR
jgi:hypothetical protein